MLQFNAPITEIIRRRFSCRNYQHKPVSASKQAQLQAFIEALPPGPFGSRPRFDLLAATETDSKSLRGLGTYGFIKSPSAFILGAMSPSEYDLEDYGYLMEAIILYATSLDLGTCWLGGTFTKSRFAKKINLSNSETMPAVTSLGEYTATEQKRQGLVSRTAGAHLRLPWDELFFNFLFSTPLFQNEAAKYTTALEMVRAGPSASNKQPWRILRHNQIWRFYLRRTPGYRKDLIKRILDLCDLQRLDIGIAMCHFELTARENNLKGKWIVEDELAKHPNPLTEYIVSWEAQS
ncbi:MAG: nitroreductase [Anaerolineae bacterium]|jgi:nitroreductase|nr:nitroreductase [Anaerolineae bacterium]MBT7192168.1 nitroreductase [Anaerolineae bacterium]MBT7989511.1 nitroreductase [Anaerolineae bacterium]